jgi:ATP-dependent helicase/nuclease subunit A
MSGLAEDARARAVAQAEFDQPLLIEAGAGTGKTAVLVARILAYSLGVGWERRREAWIERRGLPPSNDDVAGDVLRRTVAITFTEAAAAEMTARVATGLVAVHKGEAVPGFDVEGLAAGPEEIRERAEALVGALGQLGTRTIHAFCRRLLARHPLEAGLHPDVTVDADGQEQAATVRQVLEEELPRIWDDDSVAAALGAASLGPGDLEDAVVRLLGDGVRAADLGESPLSEARVARFAADVAQRLGALHEIILPGEAIKASNSRTKAAIGTLAEILDAVASFGAHQIDGHELDSVLGAIDWKKLRETLRNWRNGKIGKAEPKLGIAPESLFSSANAAQPLVEGLARARFSSIEPVHRVVRALLEKAGQRLRARGVLTYGDLLRGTRDLLVNHPSVAAQVRSDIDQLMVDEFQDTDLLQCEILAALAFGSEASPRPTLFVVGDPKQSIYGWRNADLRAFEDFKARIEAAGEVLPLVQNFRSVPAILDEVERVVRPIMVASPGLQPEFQRLEPSPEHRQARGFEQGDWCPVEYWAAGQAGADGPTAPGVGDSQEIEGEALAADLARLRDEAKLPLGEVGVLVRTITSLEPIVSALRRAGIPFVAERETEFYQRREIVDATALVRTILDPNDEVALVATLRSPVVGVPDAALAPLWQTGVPERLAALGNPEQQEGGDPDLGAVENAIEQAVGRVPEGIPGIEELNAWPLALMALASALAPLREDARNATPDRFVERVRSTLLPEATEAARYMGAHRVLHLDRFFRDLVDALERSGGSPAAVAAWLRRSGSADREHREGRAQTMARDAVQIMTIHRAKGLDFRHVYLMQARKEVGGRPGEKETAAYGRGSDAEWVLCNVPSIGHWRHREQRSAVEEAERVRLLYVALTRAKERVVVSGLAPGENPKPTTQTSLLESRSGDRSGWEGLADGVLEQVDADDARWRWVLEGEPSPHTREDDVGSVTEGSVELDDVAVWSARSQRAAEHAARPFAGRASGLGHDGVPHDRAGEDAAEAERARRIAMNAGTVVHGLLEDLVGGAGVGGADVAQWTERSALPRDREAVAERAQAIWQRFQSGPLAARLAALADRVVARELPVLVAPELLGPAVIADPLEAPVGFVSGSIDLVYRDSDGAFVVADYKTDAVEGDALRERARGYAAQGGAYATALQHALGLEEPPRFELWFLQAGAVVDATGNPLDPV